MSWIGYIPMGIWLFVLFFWIHWNNCMSCERATSVETAKNKRLYAIDVGGEGDNE